MAKPKKYALLCYDAEYPIEREAVKSQHFIFDHIDDLLLQASMEITEALQEGEIKNVNGVDTGDFIRVNKYLWYYKPVEDSDDTLLFIIIAVRYEPWMRFH